MSCNVGATILLSDETLTIGRVEINSEDTELLPLYDHLIRKTATLDFSQLFNKEKLL